MTPELVEAWIDATRADGADPTARAERWRQRLSDPAERARFRVAVEHGEVRGYIWLYPTGADTLGLGAPRCTPDRPIDAVVASLIDEAVQAARVAGARQLDLRVPEPRVSDALFAAIVRTSGVEGGGRIEFRTPLDALAVEGPSPLQWRPGIDLDAVASLLEAASEGAVDGLEPGEVAADVVRHWLHTPNRVTDPAQTLAIGALDGVDVAVVCAQADPADGWCTLPWIGLVPGARGRGLGHHVHRHGLTMLRAQGGTSYHGGTSLLNAPMRACFVRQGCQELARFRQFRWTR